MTGGRGAGAIGRRLWPGTGGWSVLRGRPEAALRPMGRRGDARLACPRNDQRAADLDAIGRRQAVRFGDDRHRHMVGVGDPGQALSALDRHR